MWVEYRYQLSRSRDTIPNCLFLVVIYSEVQESSCRVAEAVLPVSVSFKPQCQWEVKPGQTKNLQICGSLGSEALSVSRCTWKYWVSRWRKQVRGINKSKVRVHLNFGITPLPSAFYVLSAWVQSWNATRKSPCLASVPNIHSEQVPSPKGLARFADPTWTGQPSWRKESSVWSSAE